MCKRHFLIAFCIIIIIFFMNGCATVSSCNPNVLAATYSMKAKEIEKYPVVFIPGLTGSILKERDTGRTVWGRDCGGLINKLPLPIDAKILRDNRDDLVPTHPVGRFSCLPGILEMEIYDGTLENLTKTCGYTIDRSLFPFSYDWRRDLVEAAQQLHTTIERVKQELGNSDIRVNLLCHSAGGLIARYYIKYGPLDVLDKEPMPLPTYAGSKNIDKVILVATPNRGLTETFKLLHEGLCIPPIACADKDMLFTMPSLYQLLPFDGTSVFMNSKGELLEIDIYEPVNWEKYGWSVFSPARQKDIRRRFQLRYGRDTWRSHYERHIEKERRFLKEVLRRAKRFHQALWQGDLNEEKKNTNYVIIGSNCIPTCRYAVLKESPSGWETRFRANESWIKDKIYGLGDGLVTTESLLGIRDTHRFPSRYEIFAVGRHESLTQNPTVMNNILYALFNKRQAPN